MAETPTVTCGACGRTRLGQMTGGAWRFGKCECQMTGEDLARALGAMRVQLEEMKVRADEWHGAYIVERERADRAEEDRADLRVEVDRLTDQVADLQHETTV